MNKGQILTGTKTWGTEHKTIYDFRVCVCGGGGGGGSTKTVVQF